ncbi:class I SAM-dependent methyltransferase, partial [Mesorhizobium sp. B2-4-13]|uniref:Eco57I restriction-modification methylase domain-containing protein n=1 Tax=Mesorhizobium sp. B2-4-13 TaxID=2589936 RepID=UPI001152485C
MIRTERALVGLALALIGGQRKLTLQERNLAVGASAPSAKSMAVTRGLILAGHDPLGEAFCELRSPDVRRPMGATYTPPSIVDAMVGWAAGEPAAPARIVDPGAGSGRYLAAAATRFPEAALVAIELDPLACLLLRANAQVLGFANRLTIQLKDYRAVKLPRIEGATLYIGNPPYVRHHDITEQWKTWFAQNAAAQGFKASKLAGLHIHFFLKTRELARPGDFGTFITAAEWLDVNYGSVLREMLADGLGGSALHVINPEAQPFADAMATGAITCFRVGNRPNELTVRTADSLTDLAPLSAGRGVDWAELSQARRWSGIVRGDPAHEPGMIELGELFRVHRGQVTGSNGTWIENPAMAGVPSRYLKATVTRARDLITAGVTLHSPAAL